ncbi:MAG: hypothetical protein IH897_02280 [Planctomycetes bacterium]|nr:hypothetical protein [Planctomycetota bacterium]
MAEGWFPKPTTLFQGPRSVFSVGFHDSDVWQIPVLLCVVETVSDDELVLAACEHAGMLATLRWIMDPRREWGEAGIMDVGERPF